MNSILVTGANGQLGNEMRLIARNSADKFIFTDVVDASEDSISMLKRISGEDISLDTQYLDISNLNEIRRIVKEECIDTIINCAAYTNVDSAESNQEFAGLLNSIAPMNLAIAMKEIEGLLVHISTDYVFGGNLNNTPIKEDQKGAPIGIYGMTKFSGENNILTTGVNCIILRTAWLYSEFGKNFVKTVLKQTSTKPQLRVVFDQVGTPTYAYDLALAIYDIIMHFNNRKYMGIYHYTNEGVCSWYDFAKMIVEYAGNTVCDVFPCHSDEFPSPVKRPSYSVLDKSKIKDTFEIVIPYWTDSLKKCINNMMSL